MKKLFLILVAMFVFTGCAKEASAETVTSSNEKHYSHEVSVHDPVNAKKQNDLQLKAGITAEGVLKFSETARMDVTYLKDLHKTNAREGHEVQAVVVKKFDGFDLSFLNPFTWFNKANTTEVN